MAAPGGAGSALTAASRYGAAQRAFSERLREWHWQRNAGTRYQIWRPPGVVFSQLKKDHHVHGRFMPPWAEWGFEEPAEGATGAVAPPLHLVLGALGGRWAMSQASRQKEERWVVADSNDANLFNLFYRALVSFGLDAGDPDRCFSNVRLLHTNERTAARFLPAASLRSVRAHLPWPARDTRPKRDALVTLAFASDACDALEESGELHVVADSEAVVEEACGTLTRSRLFAPCLAFPFHQAGVPAAYPRGDLLCADAALSTDGRSDRQLFYSRWEKRAASLPNFRFRGGRGRNEAAPDVPPPAKRAIEAPPPGKTKLSGGARSRG